MTPNVVKNGSFPAKPNYSKSARSVSESSSSESEEDEEMVRSSMFLPGESGNKQDDLMGKEISPNEIKSVIRARWIVVLALLVAALLVGALTYTFTAKSEEDTFKSEFRTSAQELIRQTVTKARSKFGAMNTLAHTITSDAENHFDSWPFVTVDHFEIRAHDVRQSSGFDLIVLAPVVTESNLSAWEAYSVQEQGWIQKGLTFQGDGNVNPGEVPTALHQQKPNYISDWHLPVWQMGPAPTTADIVNLDLRTNPSVDNWAGKVNQTRLAILSEIVDISFLLPTKKTPYSYILQPVDEYFPDSSTDLTPLGAFIIATSSWDSFFQDALPEDTNGFEVYVSDHCGGSFTYGINGPQGRFLGYGDLHQRKYDSLRVRSDFTKQVEPQGAAVTVTRECTFTLDVYPTDALHETYKTSQPIIYTVLVLLVFVVIAMIYFLYDFAVHRRRESEKASAAPAQAIVSSLFPKSFHSRMLDTVPETNEQNLGGGRGKKSVFDGESTAQQGSHYQSRPIADLFPNTTVLFADIVGFTAWSSEREPAQVFTLLETIYQAYDEIAKKRRVFKVETVGDCYVACAGLPDPRKNHAVVMARFANDCLNRVKGLLADLEVILGPDTNELGMRFGLNSGPVTAGILRGDRARFQLFGDTVNTAARIETTGLKNRIHVSQHTADLLIAAGKEHWVCPRNDLVLAKGKGELQTYWLLMKNDADVSNTSDTPSILSENLKPLKKYNVKCTFGTPATKIEEIGEKHQRLADWNVSNLMKLLRAVKARREACGKVTMQDARLRELERNCIAEGKTTLDEVAEVVKLPQFDPKAAANSKKPDKVALEDVVEEELKKFVETVVLMYHDNPFHNFEHASHVTMSTVKLLSRIVAPAVHKVKDDDSGKELHDHTYGVASDPLTQFTVVFAALVHDLDHPGVGNAQLVKEKVPAAAMYKNKSVAEQNSIDIAWDLLMSHSFWNLRRAIYRTESEFLRFRQLLVNTVMATDIMDKDLGALRKNRWNKAFSEQPDEGADNVNRKATIVIEHLIQASDVAHTMQHWNIYTKWNERFFREMYKAYKDGRAEKNPVDNWYEGEIGFFDFYIIPLAMKLKSCGVFGVSSDEYLNYAQQNRREWEAHGREFVEHLVETYTDDYE